MRLTCSTQALNLGLQTVSRAVSARTTIPILLGVYVEVYPGRVRLMASDMELVVDTTVAAESADSGRAVLPARVLQDIVRRLPDPTVEIDLDESSRVARISSGRVRVTLKGMDPEEFPVAEDVPRGTILVLEQGQLRKLIRQTAFAVAVDDARHFLTGVLMELREGAITMVATDTFRLACREADLALPQPGMSEGAPQEAGVATRESKGTIIPARALNEVSRLLEDSERPVEINLAERQVVFRIDGTTVTSRIIEGQFPNYRQVVPKDSKTQVEIDREDLLLAVDRAAVLGRDDQTTVRLGASSDGLCVRGSSPDLGETTETIEATCSGEQVEIALRARYLTEVLKSMDEDGVRMEFTGALSPVCLRQEEGKFTYLVMPVTIV